jgi:hypothetical protein
MVVSYKRTSLPCYSVNYSCKKFLSIFPSRCPSGALTTDDVEIERDFGPAL